MAVCCGNEFLGRGLRGRRISPAKCTFGSPIAGSLQCVSWKNWGVRFFVSELSTSEFVTWPGPMVDWDGRRCL